MKTTIYIIIATLLASTVTAELVQINTEIKGIWQDNNTLEIQTEGDDKTFKCNTRTDQTWQVNLYKNTNDISGCQPGNCNNDFTNFTQEVNKVIQNLGAQNTNLTKQCGIIATYYNENKDCPASKERVIANYDNCKNTKNTIQTDLTNCKNTKTETETKYQNCLTQKSNMITTEQANKIKDSNWSYFGTGALLGAILCYAYLTNKSESRRVQKAETTPTPKF